MKEIIFLVQDSLEMGFEARSIGESIFTEGENIDELKENIREAVRCHFEDSETPSIIRLHYTKEEMIAL
ncbi:MAG: 2-oxoisovalerate dehydrogenase [Cyclobacteriaceae bacterium]|nr:2-oxoisovalerate dehydrogenase [Cyclobacteriaceae bacterium]